MVAVRVPVVFPSGEVCWMVILAPAASPDQVVVNEPSVAFTGGINLPTVPRSIATVKPLSAKPAIVPLAGSTGEIQGCGVLAEHEAALAAGVLTGTVVDGFVDAVWGSEGASPAGDCFCDLPPAFCAASVGADPSWGCAPVPADTNFAVIVCPALSDEMSKVKEPSGLIDGLPLSTPATSISTTEPGTENPEIEAVGS